MHACLWKLFFLGLACIALAQRVDETGDDRTPEVTGGGKTTSTSSEGDRPDPTKSDSLLTTISKLMLFPVC